MNAPHEDAQAATEATRDTETPVEAEGGREDLRAEASRLREELNALKIAADKAVCVGCMQREHQRDEALNSARTNALTAEQNKQAWYREKGRAETAETEASRWRDSSTKGGRLITRLRRENARLLAAWWSARIGRAKARQQRDEVAKGRDKAQLRVRAEVDQRMEVEAERDQLKAAIAKVRALAQAAERTGCGAGWDLCPSEVLAALDQPEVAPTIAHRTIEEALDLNADGSGLGDPSDELADALEGLRQGHDDLPAVRAFAADLDPRGEGS